MQLVTCAFPGTGKSTISNNAEQYGLIKAHVYYDDREGVCVSLLNSDKVPVFDSDSSIFPKENFPSNYVEHIKGLLRDFPECVIMVSSHDNVREALREAGIDYILVYPQRELKGDYLERYEGRGSPEPFIKLMDDKWNDFIDSCESDPSTSKRVLSEGEYLVDKIEELKKFWPAKKVDGNEAFPTAVISGTESIGDIVSDGEGNAVAVWGQNGLEPLPADDGVTTGDVIIDGETGQVVGTVTEVEVEAEAKPGQPGVTVEVETEVQPAPGVSAEQVVEAVVAATPCEPDNVDVEVKQDGTVVVEASEVMPAGEASEVVAEVVGAQADAPETVVVQPADVVVEAEGSFNPTAAIFAAALGDNPAPEPTVAPGPAIVDLAELNGPDTQVVVAAEEPTVAAVVVDDGTLTSEVVSVQADPSVAPVSGEVIVDGQEDAGGEVTVDVDPKTGVVEVETAEGTVTVTQEEVKVDGADIVVTGAVEGDDLVQTDADRADLIELKLDMQNDIDAIEPIVAMGKTEEHAGNEAFAAGSEILNKAAAEAKATYGIEMEPTLAGLEGFLEGLKGAVGKITAALKSKPTKQDLSIVKKYLYENEKAAAVYSSADWQGKQTFIEGGNVTVQTPALLSNATTPSEVAGVVNSMLKNAEDAFSKHVKNETERLKAGVKAFNAIRNLGKDAPVSELEKHLPIKPEKLTSGVADAGLDKVEVGLSGKELPVLTADKVKEVVKIMDTITDTLVKFIRMEESTFDLYPGDEVERSAFIEAHENTGAVKELLSVIEYRSSPVSFTAIDKALHEKLLPIAQFLESWILKSVK
ncbi:hypothetical protein OBP_161 [Pseudomonas phage OBP]|uniref:hypothetical protein n=1 Tax=Pseudomonas phage OBP TaxID=1124849 RepID=UPI000240D581|nr:hypothetical protein OBP_161 [Pseudomonas phage OBP]AEV89598.1 hypothetical protein OBP_161 [Pseudomonas phage OBP]